MFHWICPIQLICSFSGPFGRAGDVRLLRLRQHCCCWYLRGGAHIGGARTSRRHLRGGAASGHQRQPGELPDGVHRWWETLYTYIHTYMHTYTRIRAHAHTHTHAHAHTRTRAHSRTRAHTHTHTCTHACMHTLNSKLSKVLKLLCNYVKRIRWFF